MTTADDDARPIALPDHVIANWHGRYNFASVLVELASTEHADIDVLALAVLDGIVAGRDEAAVIADLLYRGEFAAVEDAIDRPDAAAVADLRTVRDRLVVQRTTFLRRAREEVRILTVAAEAAEVHLSIDKEFVDKAVAASWRTTKEYLDRQHDAFEGAVADLQKELRSAAVNIELDPRVRGALEQLVAKRQLKAARAVLDNGGMPDGPLVIPPMRQWAWRESPVEVLRWHLDAVPTPPSFSQWAPVDDTARDLLVEYDRLSSGGEQAIRKFAEALDDFLGGTVVAGRQVHRVDGGYLTTLYNVFTDSALTRFRPSGVVDLFVVEPGVGYQPDLTGIGPHIVVGHHLELPSSGARSAGALLTTQSVLRLVTVGYRRAVALVRTLGSQWPLSAFGVGTPRFSDLISGDTGQPWEVLTWILDLAGLPGVELAEAVVFQSGYEPQLIEVLAEMLLENSQVRARGASWRLVGEWSNTRRWQNAIEAAALRPIRGDAAAVAVFWLALASEEVGQRVAYDSILLTAALIDEGPPLDEVLRAVDLRNHWFVADSSAEHLTLRRIGVLLGLQSLAEARLTDVLANLRYAVSAEAETKALGAWDVTQYVLTSEWLAYTQANSSGDEVTASKVFGDVIPSVEDALAAARHLTGSSDVTVVFACLVKALQQQYPLLTVRLHLPASLVVRGHERVVSAIGYQLLANAAEAVNWDGTILVAADRDGSDAVVNVQDDGPGLVDGHSRIFRNGYSTRAYTRGAGLYLARQLVSLIEGDLELASRAGGHPVYRGAHFRLLLHRE